MIATSDGPCQHGNIPSFLTEFEKSSR